MDPLSDALSLVKPSAFTAGGLTAGGRWGVQFPTHQGIKCYAIAKGQCFVGVDGEPGPLQLRTGECILLPHGRAFRLCSDLDAISLDARSLSLSGRYNAIEATPGDDFLLLGGHFVLHGNAEVLLSVLPSIVHLRTDSNKAALRGSIEQLVSEMRQPQPGGFLLAQQSAYTMLILALRLFLAEGGHVKVGWLAALADPRIGAALTGIHEAPSRTWTVEALGKRAGMSRTTFAQRFRQVVGTSPIEYVTRWRMLLAADRLRCSTDSVSAIAEAVGYESESAFSAAFKRTMGSSPREYAQKMRSA